MNLYYHKDPSGNFGDDLNPWLWKRILPGFFDGVCFHDPAMRNVKDTQGSLFVGIGTLLNRRIPAKCLKAVFGTGMGYGDIPQLDNKWNFYCVRGPLTAAKLGIDASLAVTDSAMLIKRINLSVVTKQYPVSFMPHVSNAKLCDWQKVCVDANIHFIDPRRSVDEVLVDLRSSDTLLTEAMHGAILADALRVPWIAVNTAPQVLEFKWWDWCKSLQLDYCPVRLPTLWSLPTKSKLSSRLIYPFKYRAALKGLRTAAGNVKPILSNERVLEAAVQKLEEKLEHFKRDYLDGKFN